LPKSSEIATKIRQLEDRIAAEKTLRTKAPEREPEKTEEEEAPYQEPEHRIIEIREKDEIPNSADEVSTEVSAPREKIPLDFPVLDKTRPAGKRPTDFVNKNILLISAVLLLAAAFIMRKLTSRGKKAPRAKLPPGRKKDRGAFDPRDLEKFLDKKAEGKDKDLFK